VGRRTRPGCVSCVIDVWEAGTNLHDGPVTSTGHDHTLLLFECDPPDSIGGCSQFSNQLPSFEIPNFHSPITTSTHNSGIVKLQTRDAIVVCCESMNRCHLLQRPYSH